MPRKQIDYEEWIRARPVVEARSKRILAFFDLDKLKRKPRNAAKDAWLKAHNQESAFESAEPRTR